MSDTGPAIPDATRALYDSIRGIVARAPEADKLREALVTELTYEQAKGKTEYGAAMHNPYADPKMPGMPGESDSAYSYTSPYPKVSAGVTTPVTYAATDTNDVYAVLGRKWKDPADHAKGLRDEYILIGGYMNPPLPGAVETGRAYDSSLTETALRELREETGLALPSSYVPKSLMTDSRHGVSNDPREPTINEVRHINLSGPMANLPALHAGDDVAEAIWVNARDTGFHPETAPQPFGSMLSRYDAPHGDTRLPIIDAMGEYLDRAVAEARRTAIRELSRNGHMAATAAVPQTQFGPQAHALHLEHAAAAAAGLDRAPRPAANENAVPDTRITAANENGKLAQQHIRRA